MRRFMPLSIILTLLLVACTGAPAAPTPAPTNTPAPTRVPATPTPSELSNVDLVEKLRPSVVFVEALFGENAISHEGLGSGTGIVYDAENGYIVTNAHVVEGASAIKIAQAESSRYRSARVVGRSQCDDLAVLKVDNTSGLEEALLGESDKMKVGSDVLALGYPKAFDLGTDLTVTDGTLSKLRVQRYQHEEMIQHNAAITHGNSGGPLVNRRGEVIGINTQIFYSEEGEREPGINFAIAMSYAEPIIKELEQGKNRHYIGLNLYPNVFEDYFGTSEGMAIIGVTSGSPAAQVGLQPADLLMKIEGTSVNSEVDVCNILRSHSDGDQLKVTVLRPTTGEVLEGELTMGKVGAADEKTQKIGVIAKVGEEEQETGGEEGSEGSEESGVERVTETDFEDNQPGPWATAEEETFSATVVDGHYVIDITTSDNRVTSYPDGTAENMPDGGVFASVVPEGDGYAGVMARYVNNDGKRSLYACWISAEGMFGCYKEIEDEQTYLTEPTQSDNIKVGAANEIGLIAVGNYLVFQINGEDVAEMTDSSLTTGAWGVVANTTEESEKFTAYYDYIIILSTK